MRAWLPALTLFSAFSVVANVNLVNVTIDDQAGDALSGLVPTYSPTDTPYGNCSPGPACTACHAQPDPAQVFDGTWHDTTYIPGWPTPIANISFTGAFLILISIWQAFFPSVR